MFASVVAKSLWHIDRTAFASTDFSSFESTMRYFHACVLVFEWGKQQHLKHITARDRLQLEDIATIRDREKIDATFAALLAMPDGQQKSLYHIKVRLACMDMHRFFQDFNSLSQDEIEILCSKPVKELTQDERMAVFGIGFGTNMLVRTSWWSCPVRR
ncbi:hypothetical protein BDZ89DRAFT_1074596 [Hymenopellis radicata]|nr:hypothetical protein BDZ89DRAFT_1074596 [Hymenopellis radicata]